MCVSVDAYLGFYHYSYFYVHILPPDTPHFNTSMFLVKI